MLQSRKRWRMNWKIALDYCNKPFKSSSQSCKTMTHKLKAVGPKHVWPRCRVKNDEAWTERRDGLWAAEARLQSWKRWRVDWKKEKPTLLVLLQGQKRWCVEELKSEWDAYFLAGKYVEYPRNKVAVHKAKRHTSGRSGTRSFRVKRIISCKPGFIFTRELSISDRRVFSFNCFSVSSDSRDHHMRRCRDTHTKT